VSIKVKGAPILSAKSMNVLGVVFDKKKLNWKLHVVSAIKKANSSLYAIPMKKSNFTQMN
jgi:hypothetical protein